MSTDKLLSRLNPLKDKWLKILRNLNKCFKIKNKKKRKKLLKKLKKKKLNRTEVKNKTKTE